MLSRPVNTNISTFMLVDQHTFPSPRSLVWAFVRFGMSLKLVVMLTFITPQGSNSSSDSLCLLCELICQRALLSISFPLAFKSSYVSLHLFFALFPRENLCLVAFPDASFPLLVLLGAYQHCDVGWGKAALTHPLRKAQCQAKAMYLGLWVLGSTTISAPFQMQLWS